MLTHDAFLKEIEAFLSATGMAPTAFGREAVGDPNLIRDLRDGRSVSLRTAAKVSSFIQDRLEESRNSGAMPDMTAQAAE